MTMTLPAARANHRGDDNGQRTGSSYSLDDSPRRRPTTTALVAPIWTHVSVDMPRKLPQ
jgi:hypothetical protein